MLQDYALKRLAKTRIALPGPVDGEKPKVMDRQRQHAYRWKSKRGTENRHAGNAGSEPPRHAHSSIRT